MKRTIIVRSSFFLQRKGKNMRKVSPRLVAIMMAGAVTVTSITPVTGYQTITVNAATDSQEKELSLIHISEPTRP